MKTQNINSKTAIKCTFSNKIHKLLEPNINEPSYKRWKFRQLKTYTNDEKLKIFEEILKIHEEMSSEYTNCLKKNRFKKNVQKLRKQNN